MSHFSVMVIGENPEAQLAPFHEFECTGHVDEYVKSVDKTQEAREAFQEDTDRFYVSPEGERIDKYDDRFYREPTEEEAKKIGPLAGSGFGDGMSWTSKDWGDGKGYSTRIHFLPEGWTETEAPGSESKSFAQFIEDYYGYKPVPAGQEPDLLGVHKFGWYRTDGEGNVVEVIDRTNPRAKWDWYQLGGRWTGFFTLRPDVLRGESTRAALGSPGLMTEQETTRGGRAVADQARKGDIDVAQMRREAEDNAAAKYDRFHAIVAGHEWPLTWAEVRAKHGCGDDVDGKDVPEGAWDRARTEFNGQATVKHFASHPEVRQFWGDPWTEYKVPRDQYLAQARRRAIVPFAVLKDGEWYERGEMGWWGAVSNEKDPEEWAEQFEKLFDALPDDTLVSIYDCHI